MGGSCCSSEWNVIWKSESMHYGCNALLHNTFHGRPCNFLSGLIKLSCNLYLVQQYVSVMSPAGGAKVQYVMNQTFSALLHSEPPWLYPEKLR